ncbi:protein of unknown function [Cyanobium sp. NIES-981]|nr:protein of unknown function [Cyanobium sp. NIES-981]
MPSPSISELPRGWRPALIPASEEADRDVAFMAKALGGIARPQVSGDNLVEGSRRSG